jgi:hypothetical protein
VIVRISSEGQYDLADDLHEELNRLDDAVVAAVEGGDEDAYQQAFTALLDFVREQGTEHDAEDLHGSDFILPPADLTFVEAQAEFTGDGLIPDPQ